MYCIQYILIARNIALYALLLGTVNNNIKIIWVALSDKCGVGECANIGWHMTHQLTLSEGASHVESQSYITVLQREFIYQGIFHTVWEIISDTKKLFYSTNINTVKLCCWIEYVQRFQVWLEFTIQSVHITESNVLCYVLNYNITYCILL